MSCPVRGMVCRGRNASVHLLVDKEGKCAYGMVVRDSSGTFVEAVAQCLPNWEDIEVVEACSLKEA